MVGVKLNSYLPRMITCQHEFVEFCRQQYLELGLEPGNPLHGDWHKAHYPVPRCMGGEDWVWLLTTDHAIQGVLQSLEYSRRCIRSWERKYLPAEYLPLYSKAMAFTTDYRPSPKNTTWVNNGKEQKRWREGEIPAGWKLGRLPVKWITDGINNKMIPRANQTPTGWREGRVGGNPTEGKKWINNGTENKLILPGDEVPEGWVKGILR